MNKRNRSIRLKPSWKSWFWYWLAAIILLPLFGIGLLPAFYALRKQSAVRFVVKDRSLVRRTRSREEEIDLLDIQSTNVHQSWIEKKLNTGTVLLYVGPRMIEMPGMTEPDKLSGLIRKAAEAARSAASASRPEPEPSPSPSPGTLDKMDYLTGLWQQGLISNEEYEREKKYFE
jgi:hypothetical protein